MTALDASNLHTNRRACRKDQTVGIFFAIMVNELSSRIVKDGVITSFRRFCLVCKWKELSLAWSFAIIVPATNLVPRSAGKIPRSLGLLTTSYNQDRKARPGTFEMLGLVLNKNRHAKTYVKT
jgi:hypothetical protein